MIALLIYFAATFVPAASASVPLRCASLHGKPLVSNRAVKVVEHRTERRGTVYMCVPPNGRVRVAGSAYDAVAGGEPIFGFAYTIDILAVAGPWVAISYTSTIDYHGREEIDKTFNAANGKSYRFFETGIPEGEGFEGIAPISGQAEHVQLNRSGQLALALVREGTTEIIGVEANGTQRVLDSAPSTQIPVASITLEGHTVRWVDSGGARSAPL